jgi:hypothetical protein
MSVKEKFTPEEWKSLLRAPMLASYAVVGAAPSKQDDFIKEMAAVADGIIEGGRRASKDSLLGAVVAEIVANAEDEQRGQTEKLSLDAARARALDTCRAAAAKEGGLFGFGGEQVSGAEVATINEIGEALKI